MRRGDDQSALGAMIAHGDGEFLARGAVERGQRLVEEPERPKGDEETRQRRAPLLAGGQHAERRASDMAKADDREGGVDRAAARSGS